MNLLPLSSCFSPDSSNILNPTNNLMQNTSSVSWMTVLSMMVEAYQTLAPSWESIMSPTSNFRRQSSSMLLVLYLSKSGEYHQKQAEFMDQSFSYYTWMSSPSTLMTVAFAQTLRLCSLSVLTASSLDPGVRDYRQILSSSGILYANQGS